MGIDCTCTLGVRSLDWDEEILMELPVYDGLIDPFCPIHSREADTTEQQ